jgi:hypothetical protein
MSRITNQELQVRVDYLNRKLNRDPKPYSIGHIDIDHYAPGDNPYQYKLVEVMNESGGIHEWTSYRMTRAEFYAYLNGLCDGLDLVNTKELTTALSMLVDHASEQYPHFESERGQAELAQARQLLANQ